jgi:quercetin dioxygenase-like cupin family protein
VLDIHLPPGGHSPMHSHPQYIIYTVTAGKARFTSPDGTTKEVEFKPGDAMLAQAESHAVDNIGQTEMHVLNIELKQPAGGMAAGAGMGEAMPAAAQMHEHLVVTPEQVKWAAGPNGLPPGAQMAVLEGDPSKPGPFTIRAKMPANYAIPAHWHPADEHVTVISGTFNMGTGDKFDASKGKALPKGSFSVMPAKTNHFAFTKEETVLQVHGIGPWGITYVNPADDPRKQ